MRNLTLLTDFYELTMMNGYLKEGIADNEACFDVFIVEETSSNTQCARGWNKSWTTSTICTSTRKIWITSTG